MKLPIPAIAALLIGVAAGAYISPARTAPAEDHAGADSTATQAATTPHIDTTEPPIVPEVAVPTAVGATAVGEADADTEALVKAVSDLAASDAAPMLARLDDEEAVGVLHKLPLAKASAILDAMPKDRATTLSRLLLLAGAGT